MLEQETVQRTRFSIETLTVTGKEIIFIDIEHEDETQLPPNWLDRIQEVTADFGPDDLFLVEYYPPDFSPLLSKIPGLKNIIASYVDQKIGPSYNKIFDLAREKESKIAVADIANNLIYTLYELLSQIPQNIRLVIKYLPRLLKEHKDLEECIELMMRSEGVYADFPLEREPIHAVDARRFYTASNLHQVIERSPDRKIVVVNAPAHNRRVREYLKKFEQGNKMRFRFAVYSLLLGVQRRIREY